MKQARPLAPRRADARRAAFAASIPRAFDDRPHRPCIPDTTRAVSASVVPKHHRSLICAVSAFVLAACSTPSASAPAAASASASEPMPDPISAAAAAAAPEAASAPAPAAASVNAPASAAAPEPTSAPEAASAAAPEAPLPNVKVTNIGMHIGGGPNDAPTKAPIRKSVEPHFDEFRRCFALVEDPQKGGDVSIDLRIEKDGGKATVKRPKTSLKGADFKDCIVRTFEGIDFLKPKGGATVVSYSLRFTPSS